jgi:3-dehydroquinate dehydratase / shikimate dehydrogenase
MPAPTLQTARLILRQWKEGDLPLFADLNASSDVMKYFPSTLSRDESDLLAEKIQRELDEKEYGLWAVEVKGLTSFIGFVGLHYHDFSAAFTPCIEIGWRLATEYWGKGYAFEAATKVVNYAFNTLKLEEIVSFTTPENKRSRNVMEKLGMTHDTKDDFYHTKLPKDHPLGFHVLYRLQNPNF